MRARETTPWPVFHDKRDGNAGGYNSRSNGRAVPLEGTRIQRTTLMKDLSRPSGEGPSRESRASGKHLAPEELLVQLEGLGQDAGEPLPLERRAKENEAQRGRYSGDPLAPDDYDPFVWDFIQRVRSAEYFDAWVTLQRLHKNKISLTAKDRSHVGRRFACERAVTKFLAVAVQKWKKDPDSSFPSPKEVFPILAEDHNTNPNLWAHNLWQMAAHLSKQCAMIEKNDLHLLWTGVEELVEAWRICMLSVLRSASNADQVEHNASTQSPPESGTSGSITSDLVIKGWDFLPNVDELAARTQDTDSAPVLHQVLMSLMPYPDQTKDGSSKEHWLNGRTFDYTSPAIVTFDILRQLNERTGRSVHNQPGLLPFFKLLDRSIQLSPTLPRPPKLVAASQFTADRVHSDHFKEFLGAYRLIAPGSKYDRTRNSAAKASVGSVESLETGPTEIRITQDNEDPSSAQDTIDEAAERPVDGPAMFSKPLSPHIERLAMQYISRLARARATQNLRNTQSVDADVRATAEKLGADKLPIELYEHLMMTYLSIQSPKHAVDVWDFMIKAGHQPTVKTYTVVIQGARASRDLTGMEYFWARMRQTGVRPDAHAWTARIYGLIKLRKVQEGLRALHQFGNEWLEAAKNQAALEDRAAGHGRRAPSSYQNADVLARYPSSVGGVPRPTVAIMNSAISALATVQDRHIPDVVKWGRAYGIEPDLITYNALLNYCLRKNQADEATVIMERMRAAGVEPDSTTWTVLLSAVFQGGFIDGLDPAEQQAKVLSFIRSATDSAGKQMIDEQGYALIIDRLLKKHNNPAAASAVLYDMLAQGLRPNKHIYTILLSSYFQRTPPDVEAIEELWRRMQHDGAAGPEIDTIFYDRMIEGLAEAATTAKLTSGPSSSSSSPAASIGIEPALTFLRRAESEGKKPGWRALENVARMLATHGEVALLRALVADVRARLASSRGATQHKGQREFWDFVVSTGILREEGIVRREQIMPAKARPSPFLAAAAVEAEVEGQREEVEVGGEGKESGGVGGDDGK